MKKFTLEEYLKNPDRKLITKDGRNVRIRCTDVKGVSYPVLALIDDGAFESSALYTKNGEYNIGQESYFDLFFAPEKKEGWVNIYEHGIRGYEAGIIHDSEEVAKKNRLPKCITTVRIEWEE